MQNWFLCSSPIIRSEDVRSLNVRLHALYGGDPAVVNPSRLMRLPGTIAWPWKAGRALELTEFIQPGPDDKRPANYSLAMLLAQLPEAGAGKQKEADGEPFDFGIPGAGLSTVNG